VANLKAMPKSLWTLLSAGCVIFLLCVADCKAQEKELHPTDRINDVVVKQASIYFNAVISDADKNFIVGTFIGLSDKVISCTANPYTQFINITYTEKLREHDILEVLQINGYDAYLRKGDHLKIVLTNNGEALEELVK
jgi:hypothetical protein